MKRILLVDDDEPLRRTFSILLQRAGYEIFAAENGKDALEQFEKNPCPVVIMDLIMPEKEGLETIVEMRRLQPNLKILAVSGGGRVGPMSYLEIAKELGATRTLAKPFALSDLIDAVGELFAEIEKENPPGK